MLTLYLLQTALPLILTLWLLLLPPRHGAGFWMLALAAGAMTFATAKLGIWVFPPCWVPHPLALVLVGLLIWRLIRPHTPHFWTHHYRCTRTFAAPATASISLRSTAGVCAPEMSCPPIRRVTRSLAHRSWHPARVSSSGP
jgi:hypothetical protein